MDEYRTNQYEYYGRKDTGENHIWKKNSWLICQIDNSLNKAERIHSFIEKVGNPYAFRVGNVEVEISFESDGESLQDKMERYFETIVF